ncbi:hypothetical protein MSAN_01958900 [Mycena sanguinolenta]|uniref:Uncharacterized protein n=1 Tax=Mycena sanguinolenta TaxID=230812 RepID=A0A8H7CN14_9AGAR|nr:hypothetical protein MSAN_01958900 [Mycena sanguinolenta]
MAIATKISELWTAYTIHISRNTTTAQLDILLKILKNCLQRAGNRNLSIWFIDYHNIGGVVLDYLRLKYSHRIGALGLKLSEDGADAFLCRSVTAFNELQRLDIHVQPPLDYTEWEGFWPSPEMLALAPKLSEFVVKYEAWHPLYAPPAPEGCLRSLGLSLALLTVIEVTAIWVDYYDYISIFLECPQLTECSIYCDEGLAQPDPLPEPTLLRHLSSLHLTFRALHSHLWDIFDAPNLVDLCITTLSDDDSDAWNHSKFMNFQERSGFTLITLALRFDFSHIVHHIIDLLKKSPALENLELRWLSAHEEPSEYIQQLIDALTVHTGEHILPELARFQIDATEKTLHMLESRCAPRSRLTHITLYDEAPFTPSASFRNAIETLKKTGVTVEEEPMDFYGAELMRPFWAGHTSQ